MHPNDIEVTEEEEIVAFVARNEGKKYFMTGYGNGNPYRKGTLSDFCWVKGYIQSVESIEQLIVAWKIANWKETET